MTNAVLSEKMVCVGLFDNACVYAHLIVQFLALLFQTQCYLFRASAAVSRSERMADQRCSPRVLTAVLWADRQAGWDSLIFFRPLAVIDSSTRPPRPPPTACAKPSRCNGRRFRTSVVRSIPSQSLNSAMLQLSLAFNASKIDPCVGRMPCRRISASKNWVTTRVTQRKLKQTQFSIADRSSSLGMVCICTTGAKLSSDFWFLNFQRLCRGQKYLKITPSRKARCPSP